jgi:type 1 fimbria pilin
VRSTAAATALLLAALLIGSAGAAQAFEVDSSDKDVDVLVEGKTENAPDTTDPSKPTYYLFQYEAHNRRDEPVIFTINLTACDNCRDKLAKSAVRIEPGQTVSVGSVERDDASKDWSFKYSWEWDSAAPPPDTQPNPGANAPPP